VLAEGVTNEKGSWTVLAPGPGRYTITAEAPLLETGGEVTTLVVGDNTRTLYLKRTTPRRRTMNILVREAGKRNTVPIEGAAIRVKSKEGKVVASRVTNGFGRCRVELEPGVYQVWATKEGYRQVEVVHSDLTRGDDQPEVPMARGGRVPVKPDRPVRPGIDPGKPRDPRQPVLPRQLPQRPSGTGSGNRFAPRIPAQPQPYGRWPNLGGET